MPNVSAEIEDERTSIFVSAKCDELTKLPVIFHFPSIIQPDKITDIWSPLSFERL